MKLVKPFIDYCYAIYNQDRYRTLSILVSILMLIVRVVESDLDVNTVYELLVHIFNEETWENFLGNYIAAMNSNQGTSGGQNSGGVPGGSGGSGGTGGNGNDPYGHHVWNSRTDDEKRERSRLIRNWYNVAHPMSEDYSRLVGWVTPFDDTVVHSHPGIQDDKVDTEKLELFTQKNKFPGNPYNSQWQAAGVVKRDDGWYDVNTGTEVCPSTRKAILPDGSCTEHHTDSCDQNKNAHGIYDPLKNTITGRTLRERVINSNLKFYSNYKEEYYNTYGLHWTIEKDYAIAEKIEAQKKFFQKAQGNFDNLQVKDIDLDVFEKAALREKIIKKFYNIDGIHEGAVLQNHNIDKIYVKGKISGVYMELLKESRRRGNNN